MHIPEADFHSAKAVIFHNR